MHVPPKYVFFSHESHRFPEEWIWGSQSEAMLSVRFQEAISTYMKITQVPILNPCLSFLSDGLSEGWKITAWLKTKGS